MKKQHHGHASRDSAIPSHPEERGFPRSLMKDTCTEHESNKDGEIYKANKDGLDRILENISEKNN